MFERESDWRRFINLVSKGDYPLETLAKEMKVGLPTVKGYHDQANGRGIAHTWGMMPDYLLDKIVGFRYRRLYRWVMTDDILQARKDYDAGEIELAQGLYKVRSEDAWVLFKFTRKKKRSVKQGRDLRWFE